MRSSLLAGLACLFGLLQATAAHALQFEQIPISATEILIGARGPIVKGDAARLQLALNAIPQGKRLAGLALDSPGGNVVEGEQLAHLIQDRRLPVIIPSNSKCVSACFLLLVASPRRLAAANALVGVHSASEDGEETDTSLAVTTLMARLAAEMGIPPAIIGKMVQTTPGRVEWLTHADLHSMDVTIFDADTPAAAHEASIPAAPTVPAAPATALPVAPVAAPPVVAPPLAAPGSGFAAGRDDRRVWNAWVAGLRGDYREGALYAQRQLGLMQPTSCYGAQGTGRGDFALGCQVALQRLGPISDKGRANPDYAAGWNAKNPVPSPYFAAAPAVGPGVASTPGAEAEYQGAYFCGRQIAQLKLTLFPGAGQGSRRAMFSFGPMPTSPGVPRGAFIVEGSIDPHGGQMSMAPVDWVTQPPGYNWIGLSGHSEDGGKTFLGRVTDSANGCTTFTMRRVNDQPVRR